MAWALDGPRSKLLSAFCDLAICEALVTHGDPAYAPLADRVAHGILTRLAAGSRGAHRAHCGGGFSALPATKAWRSRSQGNISAQQWELLSSPWKLVIHRIVTALAWQDKTNTNKARLLTRQGRRRLDNARARLEVNTRSPW